MFELGEIVVCISEPYDGSYLNVGKRYVVLDANLKVSQSGEYRINAILIELGQRGKRWYDINLFMSLPEYRRRKLEKICSKLNTFN